PTTTGQYQPGLSSGIRVNVRIGTTGILGTFGRFGPKLELLEEAEKLLGKLAAVVHARHLVLAAELTLQVHPGSESTPSYLTHFCRPHRQVAVPVGRVVFVLPAQRGVQLGCEPDAIARRTGEFDEIEMVPRRRRFREHRTDVKIDDFSAAGRGREGY